MDGHDHHEHHAQHLHPQVNTTTIPTIPVESVTKAIVEAGTMLHSGHGHDAPDAHSGQIHNGHHDGHHSDLHTPGASAHSASGEEHSMKMWFHGGFTEVVLFDFWRIDSWTGLFLSCVLVFLMAAAYEALKWFRVHFQLWANNQHARRSAVGVKHHQHPTAPSISFKGLTSSTSSRAAEEALIQQPSPGSDRGEQATNSSPLPEQRENQEEQVYAPTVTPAMADRSMKFPSIGRLLDSMPFASAAVSPSVLRWIESALYCIQLTLAYWLMLIAMTYNTYLTAMVVLGAGFGHWLFATLDGKSPTCQSPAKAGNNNNEQVACKSAVDDFASDACH